MLVGTLSENASSSLSYTSCFSNLDLLFLQSKYLLVIPSKAQRFWRHINGRRFITAERYKLIPFKLVHFGGAVMDPRASTSQKANRCLFAKLLLFIYLFFSSLLNKRGLNKHRGSDFLLNDLTMCSEGRCRSFFSLHLQRWHQGVGVFRNS